MPRKKAEEKVPATSVSAIRKKAAKLSASEDTAAAKTVSAKTRVTRAPKKKTLVPASDSLLSLSGAVNGHRSHASDFANGHPTVERIAERAYFLWLERGCPQGMDEQNWVDAERELGVHS